MSDKDLSQSPNPVEEKRKTLQELVPEAFTEGKLDVNALKRLLGEESLKINGERYALTWAGKGDAYKTLQTPTTATLRPERALSINFDEAQHVFIEGENLEALKILQKAYFGKIKLIYIDPPYNTGSDSFIYPDRFQESKQEYLKRVNDLNDDGTLMREGYFRKNSKENGQFHSNWLSMMLPRLYIARNLLKDDGVIFVSCDDNEVHNLRCLMNEVFGEENFISQFTIQSNPRGRQSERFVATVHDYVVAYAKNALECKLLGAELSEQQIREYKYEDEHGEKYRLLGLRQRGSASYREDRPSMFFEIFVNPKTKSVSLEASTQFSEKVLPRKSTGEEGRWMWGREKISSNPNLLEARFIKDREEWDIFVRDYLRKPNGDDRTTKLKTIWADKETNNQNGTQEVKSLMKEDVFSFPKPTALLKRIANMADDSDGIVLDFFAGSGTMAQAVIEANREDDGNRKCICIQLPEDTKREDYKAISEIARERIRRVIKKAKEENGLIEEAPSNLGFKSFKVTPSNLKIWRGDEIETVEELSDQIKMFVKTEKDRAETEAILYELLLKFGQELTIPIETLTIEGSKVFAIRDRQMLFVLESLSDAMIVPLVEMKPREIVALDSVFKDSDQLKSNLGLQCRDAEIKFTSI